MAAWNNQPPSAKTGGRRAKYERREIVNALIGRLYVHHRPDEFRILDIALLSECRGQGIGTGLLEKLMRESEAARLPPVHPPRLCSSQR